MALYCSASRNQRPTPKLKDSVSKQGEHNLDAVAHVLRNPHALTPLVLFMGFIGAALRYLLEIALPAQGGFPWATLVINIFGCFVLELINRYVGRRLHLPAPLVKSLGVGLVGAFTTIAAFSTECLSLFQTGAWVLYAAYIAATAFTTFLAAFAGHYFADYLAILRLRRLRKRRQIRHQKRGDAQ